MLQQNAGGYSFLPGAPGGPFSGGVAALPGYEIVHATLHATLPWRQAFELIARHLEGQGRPRAALCAVELRCPAAYTPEGFAAFNVQYRALLEQWGLLVDGYSPAARSNVAPAIAPPAEQSLYAFSYTAPAAGTTRPSFVGSGSAERPTVRPGETSVDALREKTADVMAAMQRRLDQLTATWADVTAVNVYTTNALQAVLEPDILGPMGPAAANGIHWFYSRPPVQGLEIEIDLRGAWQEVRLPG
ncbi:MAG TPA: RidA family protein [Chloroflexota bacterium]|nr:RidA family protein [Chloroflexota bacterium]